MPKKISDAGFDWSGFYAGLSGGYAEGMMRAVGETSIIITDTPLNGYVLGAVLGANWQLGQFVLGTEGELAWSGVSGSAICAGAPASNCTADVSWMGTLKARAGVAFDRTLIFATGGVSLTEARAYVSPALSGTSGFHEDVFGGVAVGGGAEVAASEAMSVKVEYNLHDYGGRIAGLGSLSGTEATSLRPITQTLKLGVNWHL